MKKRIHGDISSTDISDADLHSLNDGKKGMSKKSFYINLEIIRIYN